MNTLFLRIKAVCVSIMQSYQRFRLREKYYKKIDLDCSERRYKPEVICDSKTSYGFALSLVHGQIKDKPIDDQLLFLDYVIDSVTNELCANAVAASLYMKPGFLASSLFKISKESFKYDPLNHTSWYYTDLDLCCVGNGYHSINAGRYLKKGSIKSYLCRTENLYETLSTDGTYWYGSEISGKAIPVRDFRFALLYTLAKERHNLRAQT